MFEITPRSARWALRCAVFSSLMGAALLGCSASNGSSDTSKATTSPSTSNGGTSGLVLGGTSGTGTLEQPPLGSTEDTWPSKACQSAPIDGTTGQYCQGPAFDPTGMSAGSTLENSMGCGDTLWGIARDFVGYTQTATTPAGMPHSDFGSHYCCGNPLGTVLATLGADGKPAYNPMNVAGDYTMSGVGLSGADAFAQWYRDVPGVNLSYLVGFHLVPSADGKARVFASKLYFPVDNQGFGNFNDFGEDGKSHNFGFTTELHTKFEYKGGEVFEFEGDDDLWVFVDKKLVIDLAGIHSAMPGSIKLDELAVSAGLVVGQVYSLDLFNAERHPAGSNFKITTSMTFVDCGIDPSVVK